MICYKDMTFCHFIDCEYYKKCERKLTSEVRQDAKDKGLLICQFAEKPECFRSGL